MSEPTGSGTQQPDPDPQNNQDMVRGTERDNVQDQPTNDPDAPVWADPTAPLPPMPPVPPGPSGTTPSYGEQPTADPYRKHPTPEAAPGSNPYAPPPPAQFGAQPPAGPVVQYPAYGQPTYPPPGPSNTSAIVLTVMSFVSLCNVFAVVPLVIGIVALTKNSTDPASSRHLTRVGWMTFGVIWALVILAAIGFVILGAARLSTDTGTSY